MPTVEEIKQQLETQQRILLQQLTEQINQQNTSPVAVIADAAVVSSTPTATESAIEMVKHWVELDEVEEVELSKRMTVDEMIDELEQAKDFDITYSQAAQIVAQYAPSAPHKITKTLVQAKLSTSTEYPSELRPLVDSGVAYPAADGSERWLMKRCMTCGRFDSCGHANTLIVSAVRSGEKTLTALGRQAVGLDPIKVPTPPKTLEQIVADRKAKLNESGWWNKFRGVGELEGTGSVKMHVENFVPEGITLICGLPKEGKSWLALSIARSLTTGTALFGRVGYEVPEPIPVLYLAAESGDGALKLRCDRMGITSDKTMFVARTLSQGLMFELNNPMIEEVIKDLRPVVILETLIRFNDGTDEDSSTENRKLAEHLFRLIAWGARGVVGIHHSRKDLDKRHPTKEAAVRGSGDGLAMVDAVWLVMQDSALYQGGKGPNEVEIVGWGRDFNPVPIRLALTRPKQNDSDVEFAPGLVSCIDQDGDMQWAQRGLKFETDKVKNTDEQIDRQVEKIVAETPAVTRSTIVGMISNGVKDWQVRKSLKRLGYSRGKGEASKTAYSRVGDTSLVKPLASVGEALV